MVCFINGNLSSNEEMVTAKTEVASEVILDDDEDDLTLQRVAGGSVIEYPPVFSPTGE